MAASAVSRQPLAVSRHPSAISHQPSTSNRRSPIPISNLRLHMSVLRSSSPAGHRPPSTVHCYNPRSGGILAKRRAPTVRQGSSGSRPRTRAANPSASERGRRARALPRVSAASIGQSISGFVSNHRLELGALVVGLVAALSLAALLAPPGTSLAAAWAGALRALFGWAAHLVLLLIAAAAGYFMALRLGAPVPAGGRIAGGLMLLAVLMAGLNAIGGATDFGSGLTVAEAGAGGGYVGTLILGSLVEALGGAGRAGVLAGLAWAGAALLLGLSISEQSAAGWQRAGQASGDLRAR